MAGLPQSMWDKLSDIVQRDRFAGANDEFGEFKVAVSKMSSEELAAQSENARLAWEFLLGFAAKKTMYRNQVTRVITKLGTVPAWKAAYMSAKPDFLERISGLHADLIEALRIMEQSNVLDTTPDVVPPPKSVSHRRFPPPKWPDWASLEKVVLSQKFMGANDEFNDLRQAVKHALPEDIDSQSAHAKITWQFLIGVQKNVRLFAAQIREVAKLLKVVPSWEASLRSIPECTDFLSSIGEAPDASNTSDHLQPTPLIAGEAESSQISPGSFGNEQSADDLFSRLDALNESVRGLSTGIDGESSARAANREDTPRLEMQSAQERLGEGVPNTLQADIEELERKLELVSETDSQNKQIQHVQPYLQLAAEHVTCDPIVAHYCRLYAIEYLMQERQAGNRDAQAGALLMDLFAEAEEKKKMLELSEGPVLMQSFAIRAYEASVALDNAGAKEAFLQFHRARLYLEVVPQFQASDGSLSKIPADLALMAEYARSRSSHLRECLRRGVNPEPPCAPVLATTQVSAPVPVAAKPAPIAPSGASSLATAKPAAVTVPTPTGPSVAVNILSGLSSAKRQTEAKKRAEQAAEKIGNNDMIAASRYIREALAYLDGLT